jgi:hypothetical protein
VREPRETRRKFNRSCARTFQSMKCSACVDVPTATLNDIVRNNGSSVRALRSGVRARGKISQSGFGLNGLHLVPHRLRHLFARKRWPTIRTAAPAHEAPVHAYSEKELIRKSVIYMCVCEFMGLISTFRMGRRFCVMDQLFKKERDVKLHLVLINAAVTAGVCSRLDAPIRGRAFVKYIIIVPILFC